MTCPFLEYRFVLEQNLPFCRAQQPGKEVPADALSFICCTGRYRICKYYDEEIIDVSEQAPSSLSPSPAFLQINPS